MSCCKNEYRASYQPGAREKGSGGSGPLLPTNVRRLPPLALLSGGSVGNLFTLPESLQGVFRDIAYGGIFIFHGGAELG